MRNFPSCMAGWFLIAASAAIPSLKARPASNRPPSSINIHKLIRNVTWNELRAAEHPAHYYCYINREVSPGGSRTTAQINTSQGVAELLLSVNGEPPDEKQRAANDHLLSRLVHDAGFRQSQLKDQRQDTSRRDNVIKNLPKAFIYTYLGRTKDGLVHLKFRPDPQFQPSSRQALVLEGMAGELCVDPSAQRIVEIDGKLIKDVTIGWGFLARLYQGGRFLMEQSEGPDGVWHQKLLSVDFDGKELIFKRLHVHEKLIRCCFAKVPRNLTMAGAVHQLRARNELPEHWKSDLEAIKKSGQSNKP